MLIECDGNKPTIIFCIIDEPFICEVYGKFTIQALHEIEEQFIDEPPDDWEYNVITVTCECNWEEPQYGDYGRVELSGYWDLIEISKTIVE